MYTDKKNILQLVALLKAHRIQKIVLCPGSRNIPIVQPLVNIPEFTCYPVTDERSAGFFALGLALNGGQPAAICCTSGTALLNIHPAVAEAGGVWQLSQKIGQLARSTDGRRRMVLQPTYQRGPHGT